MADEYDEWGDLQGAIDDQGSPLSDFSDDPVDVVDTDVVDTDVVDPGVVDPTEDDVMPIGVRTDLGEGMGFATRNADGSVSYEDPDGSTYTKTASGSYVTGAGNTAVTYNPATGTFTDSKGAPLSIGSGGFSIPKQFQKLFKTNGEYDISKILPLMGGALAMTQSNNRTQPSGYQGKIPKYTATRQEPGIGQLLSGNVLFKKPDGTVVNPNSAASSTGIAPPNKVNTGGIADAAQKTNVNPYANDPEYQRLSEAARIARGGGDIMTMDVKPEEQALNEYLRGKNPTYRANREANMGQTANQAGIAAALPTQVEPAPTLAKGGALESGGFVIPADVVSHLGNGSSEAGLRLLAQRYGATPIKGKGDGMSDSIKTTIDGRQPARVANEEARLTKSQVQAAGGAQKLYAMMAKIRQARTGSKEQGKQINPGKFMPGGAVQSYATGGTTLPVGTTGTESNLSNWAGEYVTDMLGKGQALSEMPYEQYKGPLTAGASDLQTKVSTGLQGVNFPGNLGGSFSSTTAPTIGAGGQPTGGGGIASNYMNPYLSAVLNPQLAEMRRQAEINNQSSLGGLTKSGAFGGGRQAIMESEAGRNLLNAQTTAIGQGYSNAYDKGMQQFNTEQGQAKDLAGLMANQGAVDRGIASEDIAANKAQFEEARLNPYKMVQFQQSLLSGMPLAAQTYNQAPTDNLTQFSNAATTLNKLLAALGQAPTN